MVSVPMNDHVRIEVPTSQLPQFVDALNLAIADAELAGAESVQISSILAMLPADVHAVVTTYQVPAIEDEV